MKYLNFLFIFFFACSSPSPDQSIKDHSALEEEKPLIDEDALILRLSADLVAEPKDLKEKEQNQIVNYAIDHLLDIQKTRSGLYYQITKAGEGSLLSWGDRISVHYKGYFLDGQVFDTSQKRGRPIEFYIGNMIPAWNEGLQLLRPGGKALFVSPSYLGYGEKGLSNSQGRYLVPPDAILVFELEILEKLKNED